MAPIATGASWRDRASMPEGALSYPEGHQQRGNSESGFAASKASYPVSGITCLTWDDGKHSVSHP